MAEFLRVVFVIVLILISGAAAATVGIKLIQAPTDIVGSLEACRFLTAAIGAENTIAGTTVNVIRQRCSTEYTTYPNSGRVIDTVQVKRHFAESARKVWWAVGEGAVKELWDKSGNHFSEVIDERKCVTLLVINYDSSVSSRHTFSGQDLMEFFLTEGFDKGESQYTYMEYFTGAHNGAKGTVLIDPKLEIKPGGEYGIAVTSKDAGWLSNNRLLGFLTVGFIGLAVSYFTDDTELPPTFMIIETREKLENEWSCFDIPPKGGT